MHFRLMRETVFVSPICCRVQTDEALMARAVDAINDLSRHFNRAGGSLVVQRAPATLKKNLNIWGEPGSAFPVMKRLKEKIDPTGIMNPGRFVGGL